MPKPHNAVKTVIAEQWVVGSEYTAGIVAGESLPLIRLEVSGEFYDYEAKYLRDDTRYHCPCGLAQPIVQPCKCLPSKPLTRWVDVVGGVSI